MKLLVYGALNIDLVYSVDHVALPGETIPAFSLHKSAGGKGANQAAAAAKAGIEVFMAGKIGSDGEFLLSLLHSYGANTENVLFWHGPTGHALIQVDRDGQNSIIIHAGGNGEITSAEAEAVISRFGKGDIISLQNEIPRTAEMMNLAVKAGMRICYNPSPWDEKLRTLPLNLVDIFIVNEIEGPALAGLPAETPAEKTLSSLTELFPGKEIILTAGKKGAFYGCGALREKGDIIDYPVVDTTGAGDTFTGYFLGARARDYTVAEALNFACKASSIAVSRKGAMEAIPLAAEVF
ncbi:MAG: PfkB family carbohydrate kinase [Treponema sp.]|nr:PfkB family carbohydrate kinase [Treponema sp.]